jgi:hypothetical protein
MGQVKNATDVDIREIPVLGSRGLKAGESIDVDDTLLSAHPFQYPPFEVNGVQRLGPFRDGDDFLKLDAEPAPEPSTETEAPAAPATNQE